MFGNLILAIGSAWAAFTLWLASSDWHWLAGGFAVLSLWQLYCAASSSRRSATPVVLRLGGFSWRMEDFCRGWLITGQIGTGKTTAAINAMLWQVSRNCPRWGGVCVDDKGLYWETLRAMFRQLGREEDLILLQVRPSDAPRNWKPAHTFNFLDNSHLPYSAKAKIVCDVAASLGERTEQSFFRMQAQVQMEFAFQVLAIAGLSVTLENAYGLLTSDSTLKDVMGMLENQDTPVSIFIANMANRVTFCAADEDSAKLAADTLGKRKAKRRTYGWSAGKRNTSWTEEDKYWFEPHQMRKLRKFEAVVQHCAGGFRKVTLPPLGTDGRVPAWYRN